MGFEAVFITDAHLMTNEKYGKTNPNGFNSRLQDKLDNLKKSVDYALEHDCDYWIFGGDVFHKLNPPESLRKAFIETISPLIGKIPVYIILGNHDTDFKVHSLMAEGELLGALKSDDIQVITEPTLVDLKGVEALLIPWADDGDISNVLTQNKNKIIFGHFGVSGALASGTEFVLSEGVPQKLFKKHRFAFLGHYHRYQETSKWMYAGSIAKMDMGERKDPKGFLHIKATQDDLDYEFIDLHDRVFMRYIVDQEQDPDFNELTQWAEMEGYVIKLVFRGSEQWFYQFNKGEIRKRLLDDLKVHKLFIDHENPDRRQIEAPEIEVASGWDDALEIYCKENKALKHLEIGKQLIKEVE